TDRSQGVEGGPDGAAGVEDVVDQDDGASVDPGARDPRGARGPGGDRAEVVPVHGDVDGAVDLVEIPGLGQSLGAGGEIGRAAGQRHGAVRDAQQPEVLGAVAALEYLVRDAGQGPQDLLGAQHAGAVGGGVVFGHTVLSLPRLTGR